MHPFRFAHAAGDDWREIADTCLDQLARVPAAANLGFLYVTDALAEDLDELLAQLKDATGVRAWVGAVGIGICATGTEYYEEPAAALMLGEFPPDGFRVFPGLVDEDLDAFDARHGEWIAERHPNLGLVHGDPTSGVSEDLIKALAQRTAAGFLVGGLASSRGTTYTIANGLHQGGALRRALRRGGRARHPPEPGLFTHRPPPHHHQGAAQHRHDPGRPAGPGRAQGGHRRGPVPGPDAHRRLHLRGAADHRLRHR
jgi:hypothetical protein